LKIIEPNQGSIQVGTNDLLQLKREAIRKTIGIVPQDTVLFNDTLGHNVRYGNVSATDDEVRAALGLAGMGEFLDQLASGLETEVGARGLKLSGGEKQRIAIARVILKNPPIVLLDEATSSLDVSTERQVQTNLEMLSSDRTTLVITHRLSTIRYADLILVMHDGIISESGNFDDLLAANGRFKVLWDMQQRAGDLDDTDPADVLEDWKKS
jgi:ABC-type transport system involved in Fe-S cluster assembly fused permease/ATPase subunit